MSSTDRPRRFRLRLTPWGWILALALVVLVILAIVDPGPGVVIGLIAVIFVWAGLLTSRFPSSQLTTRGRFPGQLGSDRDFGQQATERYKRERR
jgi:hypothetical protein